MRGHILLSKHLAEDLAQYRHWQPHLHDLGECEVKHGATGSNSSIYSKDGLGNPAIPGRCNLSQSIKPTTGATRPDGALCDGDDFCSAALVLVSFGDRSGRCFVDSFSFGQPRRPQRYPTIAGREKSVAVLPFENLSEEKRTPTSQTAFRTKF